MQAFYFENSTSSIIMSWSSWDFTWDRRVGFYVSVNINVNLYNA